MAISDSYAGKFFFVSGIQSGREAFLGRAVDQPLEGLVTLEGKSVHLGSHGFLAMAPFTTLTRFPLQDARSTIHQIANPAVFEEAKGLFERPITQISRTTYPLFYRWMETCLRREPQLAGPASGGPGSGSPWSASGSPTSPFASFYDGFIASANQFRRALFQAPQVHSTRELDKVTDLEGNLTIDIGKITNQIAIRFNQIIGRHGELSSFFESFQSFQFYNSPSAGRGGALAISGWTYLLSRMQTAKHWARRRGDTSLVRELNTITKEGINGLNEVILEHCSALDILIAEAFSQYGITAELHGEMSPFDGYTSSDAQGETWEPQLSYGSPVAATGGY